MENLIEERNYSVVKSNDLIRNTRYDLTLVEQKIILRLIQQIKPNDKDLYSYYFNINEFCVLCGIEQNNGANYMYIKNALKKLRDKSFWVKINEEEVLCSWLSKVKMNVKSGRIEIKLDNDLKPFLFELKKNFTEYSLFYILAMKSKYSIRMYELLKSYRYKSDLTIEIEYLKEMLLATNYDRFYDFKKKVVEMAIGEINEYTDLKVTYDFLKTGKAVTSITFKIRYNDINEQLSMFKNVEDELTKELSDE